MKIQSKSKAVEIFLEIGVIGIALLSASWAENCALCRRSRANGHLACADLRAFGVKVPAKPLKMSAEMQHKAALGLVEKHRCHRNSGLDVTRNAR